MIALLERRKVARFWFLTKHAFIVGHHLLDVLPGAHTQDTIFITEEIASQMVSKRSSTLELESMYVDELVNDGLRVS